MDNYEKLEIKDTIYRLARLLDKTSLNIVIQELEQLINQLSKYR